MGAKRWPPWSEDRIKAGFPPTSLLAGTEPAVWEALGRLEPEDFKTGKQVAVRKALDDIDLGWVATNTTPFRIAVGGLFDAAKEAQRDHARNGDTRTSQRGGRRTAPTIDLKPRTLPEPDGSLSGPVEAITPDESTRGVLWSHVETYGACVIRNAVPASTLDQLPETRAAKVTKLARTMGNGMAGDPPSVYMDVTRTPKWHDALERRLGELLMGPGAPGPYSGEAGPLQRKSILLLAGEGAENWAHQDNNDETPPLQAVLMLSEPNEDFAGGEFYVARQAGRTERRIEIVRHEVAFESPGDLVIFKAGKDSGWWHGMLPVRAGNGSAQGHSRKAIGMLQPPS